MNRESVKALNALGDATPTAAAAAVSASAGTARGAGERNYSSQGVYGLAWPGAAQSAGLDLDERRGGEESKIYECVELLTS